jgi:hypothetical protein
MHPDREALVDDAIAAHEENDRLTIEARELRARLDGLGELAGELHNAETQNADAVAAWSAAEDLRAATPRSRRGSDACLAASKQLNEAQARLCAAQDAWAGAVAGFRSDGGPT